MKKIKASCGTEIFVDAEDFAMLSRYRWHIQPNRDSGYGYARANMYLGKKKFVVSMHRLIMGMRKRPIDHIDGNTLNNRKSNLRFCTNGQNQANSKRFNVLGYKGVYRPPKYKRFFARVRANNKIYKSRLVDSLEEAAREHDKLALKHHGQFACLNFPKETK